MIHLTFSHGIERYESENSNVAKMRCRHLLYFFVIEQWAASLSSTSLVIFVNSVSRSMRQVALQVSIHNKHSPNSFLFTNVNGIWNEKRNMSVDWMTNPEIFYCVFATVKNTTRLWFIIFRSRFFRQIYENQRDEYFAKSDLPEYGGKKDANVTNVYGYVKQI